MRKIAWPYKRPLVFIISGKIIKILEKAAPDILKKVMSICGTPSENFFNRIESSDARGYISGQPFYPRRAFSSIFPQLSPQIADLTQKMIVLDPLERLTARQALNHSFFEEFRDVIESEVPQGTITLNQTAEIV